MNYMQPILQHMFIKEIINIIQSYDPRYIDIVLDNNKKIVICRQYINKDYNVYKRHWFPNAEHKRDQVIIDNLHIKRPNFPRYEDILDLQLCSQYISNDNSNKHLGIDYIHKCVIPYHWLNLHPDDYGKQEITIFDYISHDGYSIIFRDIHRIIRYYSSTKAKFKKGLQHKQNYCCCNCDIYMAIISYTNKTIMEKIADTNVYPINIKCKVCDTIQHRSQHHNYFKLGLIENCCVHL